MPKQIENYLKEGLPSKIYFYAFPKPISRYAIANLLYGKPVTSHISDAPRAMIKEGYLTEDSDSKKILSNVAPLVIEIEKDLGNQKIKLNEAENSELTNFLDNQFRVLVADTLLPEGDVNAYYNLRNYISSIARLKKFFTSFGCNDPEFEEIFKKFLADAGEELKESKDAWEKMEKISLSNSLLEKLETLAPDELIRNMEHALEIGIRFYKEVVDDWQKPTEKKN